MNIGDSARNNRDNRIGVVLEIDGNLIKVRFRNANQEPLIEWIHKDALTIII
jgi:hypothetical protein